MYLQALIWFFVAFLVVFPAGAAPVVALFTAFASTAIGSVIVNAAIGIALSIGSSLLSNLFAKKTQSRDPGTTVQLRVGGANPLMFPVGDCATAGVRVYYGVYSNGKTPNANMVDVLAVSHLPLPGVDESGITLWMNDQKVTIRTDLPDPNGRGYPIQEYRKGGKYFAWVHFRNGTQTTADPYLISRFSGHPNYPWTGDMVGRGVAYLILTCKWDKDGLWQSGYPTCLVEIPSVPLYDPRLDDTAGGVGPMRWTDQSTWQPSNNAMVRAYNVARGAFYYNGEWVYGGQNWPAHRLPVSSWMAGMNACDVLIGGEPQFHGGGMVECDMEVATVLEELLRSSSALIAEVGGTYKIRVGAPGAPVMSFTDDNIVVTREQGFNPFPGLESTYNIARITYTEPVERWGTKESPERRDAAAIISDDNRELPFSIDLPWVLSNVTAQRIGKTALENGRPRRRHSMFHAPLFWLIEPLDVVAWTSAHNQYVDKSFDVEQISGNSAMFQSLVIRENDPGDYAWNPVTDPLPYETIPVVPDIVPPQQLTGWQVFPAVIRDDEGRNRRPSIEVRFDGELTDIESVRVQVRTDGETDPFFDGVIPYPREAIGTASVILNGDFPPNVTMNVRGKFTPFTDRDTEWSAWLSVTTPDIKLIPGVDFDPYSGVVGFDQLDEDLEGYQDWVGSGVREVERRLEELELRIADQDFGNAYDRQQIRQQMTASIGFNTAQWTLAVDVVATETEALAQRVEELDAEVFDEETGLPSVANAVNVLSAYAGPEGTLAEAVTALSASSTPGEVTEANFRMQTVAGPAGYARVGAQTRVGGEGGWRGAAWYLDTPNNDTLPTRFVVDAQQMVFSDLSSGATINPLVFDTGVWRMNVANIGTITAGVLKSADEKFVIDLNQGFLSITV